MPFTPFTIVPEEPPSTDLVRQRSKDHVADGTEHASWNDSQKFAGTRAVPLDDGRWNVTGDRNGTDAARGQPSRTWMTTTEYFARYDALRERAQASGIARSDHVGFVRWLCARKAEMRPAYFRKVRASALYGLDREGGQAARDAEAVLRAETAAGTSRTPSRAPRAKGIRFDEYLAILRALADRAAHSRNAFIAFCWMMSSRAVGLRPVEWATATLSTDELGRPILLVKNAKTTNGRSHGLTRTIGLWHLLASERSAIALLLQEIDKVGLGGFGALHRATADLLYDVNRQMWPGRRDVVGLYSCRHQVAADAKAACSRRETAALMGHRTTRTAGLHYAPRSRADIRRSVDGSAALPVPDPVDIDRVEEHRHDGPPDARRSGERHRRLAQRRSCTD